MKQKKRYKKLKIKRKKIKIRQKKVKIKLEKLMIRKLTEHKLAANFLESYNIILR
jgi:hypothetical protein